MGLSCLISDACRAHCRYYAFLFALWTPLSRRPGSQGLAGQAKGACSLSINLWDQVAPLAKASPPATPSSPRAPWWKLFKGFGTCLDNSKPGSRLGQLPLACTPVEPCCRRPLAHSTLPVHVHVQGVCTPSLSVLPVAVAPVMLVLPLAVAHKQGLQGMQVIWMVCIEASKCVPSVGHAIC